MIEIIPESYDAEHDNYLTKVKEFANTALNEGYSQAAVDLAIKRAEQTGNIRNYHDFENAIDFVIKNPNADMSQQDDAKRRRIRQSMTMEIGRLSKHENIAGYADELITKIYHTHAVTILDLLKLASPQDLDIDLYSNPVISIILQIKEPWVKALVDQVLDNWIKCGFAEEFVQIYLSSTGHDRSELLQVLIGTAYENDVAPDVYKEFIAASILMRREFGEDNVNLDNEIFKNDDAFISYAANLYEALDGLMPTVCAMNFASNSVMQETGDDSLYCSNLTLPYKSMTNFDDLFDEAMAACNPNYSSMTKRFDAKRTELKGIDDSEEYSYEESQYEEQDDNVLTSPFEKQLSSPYSSIPATTRHNEFRQVSKQTGITSLLTNLHHKVLQGISSQKQSFDIKKMPIWVIALIINIVVLIGVFVMFSKKTFTISAIMLGLAVTGVYNYERSEKGALFTIIISYALFVVALFIAL